MKFMLPEVIDPAFSEKRMSKLLAEGRAPGRRIPGCGLILPGSDKAVAGAMPRGEVGAKARPRGMAGAPALEASAASLPPWIRAQRPGFLDRLKGFRIGRRCVRCMREISGWKRQECPSRLCRSRRRPGRCLL